MTEQEYSAFCTFINKLLYEIMTLDDYELILNRLDIPIRIKGKDRWGCATGCHNINSNEGGTNLSFYTEDRIFHCFSSCNCNYNLLTLVEKRFKIIGEPKKRIFCMKWICDQLGIPFEFNTEQKSSVEIYDWKSELSKYIKLEQDVPELEVYDESALNNCMLKDFYPQSWVDEGISIETMWRYEIKFYLYKNQAIIPVRNQMGDLVGIRVRNFSTDCFAKYDVFRTLDGTDYKVLTNLVMYGEWQNSFNIARKKMAMIVEGEKTVMKYDTWYGKDENICLGLMGSAMSMENVKMLLSLGIETVIIGYDSDFEINNLVEFKKFQEKVFSMYKLLRPYFKVYVLYNNLGFENCYKFSPTDYTKEQFEQLWESKELINLTDEEIKNILDTLQKEIEKNEYKNNI